MIGKILEEGNALLRDNRSAMRIGAETGASIRLARECFDSLAIETRVIDAKEASTELSLFGETFATPVMPAALSGLGGICANGLVEVAKGAKEAGAAMWAGIGEDEELAALVASGAKTIKIIKPYRDHGLILQKLRQAEKSGAIAVGMDVNFGLGGKIGDTLIRPELMAPKSKRELEEFISATRLPFVVKGVLSLQDAEKAAEAGAAAIVLSNHGGSIIDYALPPLKLLPRVAAHLGGSISLLLDGGIIRGSDVFKALASGAQGVLVGRTVMAGLAAGGAEGVRKILSGLTEELRRVMSLTGAQTIKDIDPSVLWQL